MDIPSQGPPKPIPSSEGVPRFENPQDEIAYLRNQLAERDARINALSNFALGQSLVIIHQARLLGQAQGERVEIASMITAGNIDDLRHDIPTRLPNRRGLDRALELLSSTHEEEATRDPKAVLFIDCEGFGNVNNEVGHEGGDTLIGDVSWIVWRTLRTGGKEPAESRPSDAREHDIAARVGGDELAALVHLQNQEEQEKQLTPEQQVEVIKNRLMDKLARFLADPEERKERIRQKRERDGLDPDMPETREETAFYEKVRSLGFNFYIGHAMWQSGMAGSELMDTANQSMLEVKRARKAQKKQAQKNPDDSN